MILFGSFGGCCKAVWVVKDMRKVATKTGWTMMFLYCEWYDADFEVTIFTKDYEKYKDKVAVDKIVIVNGVLKVNLEYKRKSITPRDLRFVSITQVREQAKELWLFDVWEKRMKAIVEKELLEARMGLKDEIEKIANIDYKPAKEMIAKYISEAKLEQYKNPQTMIQAIVAILLWMGESVLVTGKFWWDLALWVLKTPKDLYDIFNWTAEYRADV